MTKNPAAVALGKKGLGVKRHHPKSHLSALKKHIVSLNKTRTVKERAEAALRGWERRRKAE